MHFELMLLLILMVKKFYRTFFEKELEKANQTEFKTGKTEKVITEKQDKFYVKWKVYGNSVSRYMKNKKKHLLISIEQKIYTTKVDIYAIFYGCVVSFHPFYVLFLCQNCVTYSLIACLSANTEKCYMQHIFKYLFLTGKTEMRNCKCKS